MRELRFGFAGDRDIGVWVLEFMLSQRVRPHVLFVPEESKASHANELTTLCSFLAPDRILKGKQFRGPEGITLLRKLDLDFIIGVHFPYIISDTVLPLPRCGFLNLHPAYLPYNRGWHTVSWVILEGTPVGATLHVMDAGIDTGDIIHQKGLEISPGDTAHTLYQRLKKLELDVFKEAWPKLVTRSYQRRPQDPAKGTMHKRNELFSELIQRIDLDKSTVAGDLIRRLRALTTNDIKEAAYYEIQGKRYRIQVLIQEENGCDSQ